MAEVIFVVKILYLSIPGGLNCECLVGKDFLYYNCKSQLTGINTSHLYQQEGPHIRYYFRDNVEDTSSSVKFQNYEQVGRWQADSATISSYENTGTTSYLGLSGKTYKKNVTAHIFGKKKVDIGSIELRVDSLRYEFPPRLIDSKFMNFLPFYRKNDDLEVNIPPFVLAEWKENKGNRSYISRVESISYLEIKKKELDMLFDKVKY